MVQRHVDIGVVVARKRLKSPWAEHAWLPYAALSAVPAVHPGTPLGTDGKDEFFYARSLQVTLHPSATGQYRDNLNSGRPALWVSLRLTGQDGYEVTAVTADPSEGEALAGGIGQVVEAVPMPKNIQATLAVFIEAFHVERPFVKRERDRVDLEAPERRRPNSRSWREAHG
jgi:hypothetical protein